MPIKNNVTLYICEYCRKAYQRKQAWIKHEKYCGKNPKNQHACFGCKNLERCSIEIEGNYGSMISPYEVKGFRCKKTGKYLYTFKAAKLMNNNPCHPMNETLEDAVLMPNECQYKKDFEIPY